MFRPAIISIFVMVLLLSGACVIACEDQAGEGPVFYPEQGPEQWNPPASRSGLAETLLPMPQHLEELGFDVTVDSSWTILVGMDPDHSFAADWFNDENNAQTPLTLTIEDGDTSTITENRIVIGDPANHDFMRDLLLQRNIRIPNNLGEEGYILLVFDDTEEIIIAANTPNGTFYGITTLLQLIEGSPTVPGVRIVDYPEQRYRAIYEQQFKMKKTGGVYDFDQDLKDFVDRMANNKINVIFVMNYGIFLRDESEWNATFHEIFDYCRKRHIEPIPRIQSSSTHGAYTTKEMQQGWYVEPEPFTFNATDTAVADTPMVDICTNGDFELDIDMNDKPDGWSVTNRTGANWTLDDTVAYSGTHSMRLDIPVPTSESSSASLRHYLNTPDPDTHYLVEAWVKGTGLSGTTPQFTWYSTNTTGFTRPLISDRLEEDSDWKRIGCVIKTASDVDKVTFYTRIQGGGNGTYWIDDVRMFRLDGGMVNVMRCSDTDIVVTDITGTTTYVEGVDYTIKNGTYQGTLSSTEVPFLVNRTPTGSIGSGQQVLISYDAMFYAKRSDAWSQPMCVANEAYWHDYIFPQLEIVINNFKPIWINAPWSEVRGAYRDSRSKATFASPAEEEACFFNRFEGKMHELDPNCKMFSWDDMLSKYHNGNRAWYQVDYGGGWGRMDLAITDKMINTSVLIDVWYYGADQLSEMVRVGNHFAEEGFDILGSPWGSSRNIQLWSEVLAANNKSLGAADTNWGKTDTTYFDTFADHMWKTRNKLHYFSDLEDDIDDNDEPDGWMKIGTPYYLETSSGSPLGGFYRSGVNVTGWDYYISEPIAIRPNTDYNLSCYVARETTGTEDPQLLIDWYDATQTFISTSSGTLSGVTDDWEPRDIVATSPANAKFATLSMRGPTGGSEWFFFDVIKLTEETMYIGIATEEVLEDGIVNKPYTSTIEAWGGKQAYTYTVDSGTFPPGLTLNTDGTITGLPQANGLFEFSVRVTDSTELTDVRDFSINISSRDLEIDHLGIFGNLKIGETVQFNVTLDKLGGWSVLIDYEVTFILDGINISTQQVDTDDTYPLNLSTTWTGSPGHHSLEVVVDTTNNVSESYEDNNTKTFNFFIHDHPDLYIESLEYEPDVIIWTELVTVTATVGLNSTSPMVETVWFDLFVEGEKASTKTFVFDTVNETELEFTIYPDLGSSNITLNVDPDDALLERNETNNEMMISLTTYDRPDVWVENVTASDVILGEEVLINVTLGWECDLNITGVVPVQILVEALVIDSISIAYQDLMSGPFTFNWTPSSVGVFNLTVIVDPDDLLNESDESNNIGTAVVLVNLLPDIWVSLIEITNGPFQAGDEATITVHVQSYELIMVQVPIDILVDGDVISSFDLDLRNELSDLVTTNWTTSPGDHNITAIIDPNNILEERNESNNEATELLHVVVLPDLGIDRVAMPTMKAYVGDEALYRISFNVTSEILLVVNVTVALFVDDVVVDEEVVSFAELTTSEVNLGWTITSGEHNYKIMVDSKDVVIESDETNNVYEFSETPEKRPSDDGGDDGSGGPPILAFVLCGIAAILILILILMIIAVIFLVVRMKAAFKEDEEDEEEEPEEDKPQAPVDWDSSPEPDEPPDLYAQDEYVPPQPETTWEMDDDSEDDLDDDDDFDDDDLFEEEEDFFEDDDDDDFFDDDDDILEDDPEDMFDDWDEDD